MTIATPLHRTKAAGKRGHVPDRTNGRIHLRALDVEELAELAEQLDGATVPGVRMSEKEFVEWAFERVDAEWVDGEVILVPPGNEDHETIDEWLGRLLGSFIEQRDGGKLLRNMFVRFARKRRRRIPDLMFISTERRDRIRPTHINGAPDLIVEIVSPDSRNRDRRDKYLEYEAGGVREYWIIDPLVRRIDGYVLRARKYEPIEPRAGRFESVVLGGLYLRADWLFGPHRPKVAHVLREFGTKG